VTRPVTPRKFLAIGGLFLIAIGISHVATPNNGMQATGKRPPAPDAGRYTPYNNAFESGPADKQRAFGSRPRRRG
jgi:hypothetical protein